jgi:phage terminase Nu1 subunit (DNA packaging protein)
MSDQTFPLDTIAKLLDLTPQRVLQLVNQGVIPKKERGRYELVPVVRGYIKYLRERGLRADVSGDDYNAHRTRLTKVKADLAEMEKAQVEEQLIPSADVEAAWMEVAQNMKQKLLAFPQRVAPEVYAAEKLVEVKSILKDHIYDALQEIADVKVKVINPIRSSDSGEDQSENTSGNATAAKSGD